MGTVYLAEHLLLGKRVAIKTLLAKYSQDERLVARFVDEARAAARIQHPGIVEIHDFGRQGDGRAFLVMELLEGESLEERLRTVGPLPEPVLIEVVRQAARALEAAHTAGVVHRDLKPGNLFLVRDPTRPWGLGVKVLDFGVARLTDSTPTVRLTLSGSIVGTPTYMAPEQCKNASNVDARADVYALGCLALEMATGRPPFLGKGSATIMAAHVNTPPPLHLLDGALSAPMGAAIAAMLVKPREERLQSMTAVLGALDAATAARNEARRDVAERPTAPMDAVVDDTLVEQTLPDPPRSA